MLTLMLGGTIRLDANPSLNKLFHKEQGVKAMIASMSTHDRS